ncbi:unnamed protein product [Haemonchus placei]|uniref:CCDC92 domain-containing protein n=1 Tax=Haemonchus placei TaxID=6290 RepID=A0A0N4WJS5_HAEPC|nr:unnamed protein product [Haemonchus placei]
MTTPQDYTEQPGETVPHLTDQHDIKRILIDHEQTIEELLIKIKDIREECLCQERFQEDDAGKKICNELNMLNKQFSEPKGTLQQERHLETTTNHTQTDGERQVHTEGNTIQEDEQEKNGKRGIHVNCQLRP